MARIDDLLAENQTLKAKLAAESIGDAFNRSRFGAEKLVIPADMLHARFGSAFTVEGGRIVATDGDGKRIMSRERPGEEADFDEALAALLAVYSQRDAIMRRPRGAGPGGNGAAGKTITRAIWDALDPLEQREALTTQKMTLVD